MGRVLGSLENKVVLLIASALLGVSGNQILTQLNPDVVRPDPFTGSQGAQLAEEIREVERNLQAHLIRGEAGFYRIQELERRVKECEHHEH